MVDAGGGGSLELAVEEMHCRGLTETCQPRLRDVRRFLGSQGLFQVDDVLWALMTPADIRRSI